MDEKDIERRFAYHQPSSKKIALHATIRQGCRELANMINNADLGIPDCREKSLAITKLEEVMLWTNAAIARNMHE